MFHDRLYQLRKARGISQEELSDIVGVSRQAVQKWESGASKPDMDNLVAIARYFGVTLDYLITGEGIPQPGPAPQPPYDGQHRFGPNAWPWHYEYKSKRTLFGLPLVHVNTSYRGLTRAKGILAVGNVATGVVAVGGFSVGLVSVGGLSLGLLSLAGFALGAVAVGAITVGLAAVGGISYGLLAMGGVALGQYAGGGVAVGRFMAVGGSASSASVAIGHEVTSTAALGLRISDIAAQGLTPIQVADLAAAALPHTPRWLIRFLLHLAV